MAAPDLIVNYWPSWFRALYGGAWPESYCCVDVETTGFQINQDLITEWGHCLVEGGKVIDRLSLVIDWTDHPEVPDYWLRGRLASVRTSMQLAGRTCHVSVERMKQEGMKPNKALSFVRDFTDRLKARGVLFVAHNGCFEEKMLTANFRAFNVGAGFTFGDNGLIDTEAIEKASQATGNTRMHPQAKDTLRSYFHRVKYTRVNGLKSNLDEHCFNKYQFFEKYGIRKEQMHGAEMDSYCCHILMREYARMIEKPKAPPVYPSADQKMLRAGKEPPRLPPPTTGVRLRKQRNS